MDTLCNCPTHTEKAVERRLDKKHFALRHSRVYTFCPQLATSGSVTRKRIFHSFLLLKFIYSEKATKLCEIFALLLTGTTQVKSKVKISQNFVAFSEYMNFTGAFKNSTLSKYKFHLHFVDFPTLHCKCLQGITGSLQGFPVVRKPCNIYILRGNPMIFIVVQSHFDLQIKMRMRMNQNLNQVPIYLECK